MGICVSYFWYNFLGVWSGRVWSLDPPNYTNAISTFGLLSWGHGFMFRVSGSTNLECITLEFDLSSVYTL